MNTGSEKQRDRDEKVVEIEIERLHDFKNDPFKVQADSQMEIMVLNDAFERFFYETECMKCNWNVRELRRQIKTNLYVRAGIIKYT